MKMRRQLTCIVDENIQWPSAIQSLVGKCPDGGEVC